nr:ROK family protein [uncultured Brevundimonas sp.]
MPKPILIGGVEAGGTKFVCGVGASDGRVLDQVRIPTTTPEETLAAVNAFFARAEADHGDLAALGVCSFGPLSLNPGAADHGAITREKSKSFSAPLLRTGRTARFSDSSWPARTLAGTLVV